MIYFDNAATTPLAPEVISVMHQVMTEIPGNPSSTHALGRKARVLIEDARLTVAGILKVSPAEIFFTSSGTEALNTVLFSAVLDSRIKNIISSRLEHHAVLHTLEIIDKRGWANVHFVNTDAAGHVSLIHLEELLSENEKSMVCLMLANNEIGNLLPYKEVAELCHKNDALFLTDAVQAVGKMKLNLANSGIHFAACSGHKFHGPKGIGILYINKDVTISPLIYGGGQEREMRSGTENIYGIAGIAKAMEVSYASFDEKTAHLRALKNRMIEALKLNFSGAIFNGDCESNGLINLLSVSLPTKSRSEMLLQRLDMDGVAVSGGSACSSGALGTSHVMDALGKNHELPVIRISFSRYNTFEEVDQFIEVLKKAYK
ncbi:MAG: cysteine desulfurase family protein [Bacteroidota bacterium]